MTQGSQDVEIKTNLGWTKAVQTRYRNQLKIISSDTDLNSEFDEITYSRGKYINILLSNEDDVLNYVNNFRLKYFNITEPYDLLSPSDTFLEDEIFKTISDDDDGF